MAKKKIQGYINLQVKAGQASPSPPIGPALGQKGVNIMEFCKLFNARTQNLEQGMPVPVVITVYSDRSFSFVTKTPPASYLLLRAANATSGSSTPHKQKIAVLSCEQVEAIARTKWPDLTAASLEAAMRTIAGTARSMGIDVEEGVLTHVEVE